MRAPSTDNPDAGRTSQRFGLKLKAFFISLVRVAENAFDSTRERLAGTATNGRNPMMPTDTGTKTKPPPTPSIEPTKAEKKARRTTEASAPKTIGKTSYFKVFLLNLSHEAAETTH